MMTTTRPVSVGILSQQRRMRQELRDAISADHDFEIAWEAQGNNEAIAQLRITQPDVLLAHGIVSAHGGLRFARDVAELAPSTRVVVIEPVGERDDIGRALGVGVAGYLVGMEVGAGILDNLRAVTNGGLVLDATAGNRVRTTFRELAAAASPLSLRELEVLGLAAEGCTNKQIARRLDISVRTVEAHFSHVLGKLDVRSRTAAVTYAMSRDWLCCPDW